MSMDMRKKTSISLDPDIWSDWIAFVVTKTKVNRRVSEITEKALQEYMQTHKDDQTL